MFKGMKNVVGFRCFGCENEFDVKGIQYACPKCSGNLDVLYDYRRIAATFTRKSLSEDRDFTMWRYRALLPMSETSPAPPLTVGWTPIYDCTLLAKHYGVSQLQIKDDGRNPTGSFKDRPSALAVVNAHEAGAAVITTASSGN